MRFARAKKVKTIAANEVDLDSINADKMLVGDQALIGSVDQIENRSMRNLTKHSHKHNINLKYYPGIPAAYIVMLNQMSIFATKYSRTPYY